MLKKNFILYITNMKMIQDQKYCEIAHSESDCEPMELIDVEGR